MTKTHYSNKSIRVTIRFKNNRYYKIKRKAQESHMTISHYIRRRLNNTPYNPADEQTYKKQIQAYHQDIQSNHNLVNQLRSIGINLNQGIYGMNYDIKVNRPVNTDSLYKSIYDTKASLKTLITEINKKGGLHNL